MKLGIVIDSAAGVSPKKAAKRQWGYLPLHIFIDGKDYKSGIDITDQKVCETINIATETRTSVTSPGEAMQVLDAMKDEFDEIIVLPVSSELSSQYANLVNVAKDYRNVHVVECKTLALGIEYMALTAAKMAKEGKDLNAILKKLKSMENDSWGLIMPKQLDWLVKGGRINSRTAAMANMFKIVPIIKFEAGKLDKYGKGRTFHKTVFKCAKEVQKHFNGEEYNIALLHSNNPDIEDYAQRIERELGIQPMVQTFPSAITMHVGLGAVGVVAMKK